MRGGQTKKVGEVVGVAIWKAKGLGFQRVRPRILGAARASEIGGVHRYGLSRDVRRSRLTLEIPRFVRPRGPAPGGVARLATPARNRSVYNALALATYGAYTLRIITTPYVRTVASTWFLYNPNIYERLSFGLLDHSLRHSNRCHCRHSRIFCSGQKPPTGRNPDGPNADNSNSNFYFCRASQPCFP